MSLQWPWMLLCLLGVPLLIHAYRQMLARRAARLDRLAQMGLVATPRSAGGRRALLVPVLFLLGYVVLAFALARPQLVVGQPVRDGTVVLAFDVSASMKATDLEPSRIEAAKAAARTFVQRQPSTVRISVVTFGTSGLIICQPTDDREQVLAAIDRISVEGGTALGKGIQTSLSAIAGRAIQLDEPQTGMEPQTDDIGYFPSAAIVLLSDGENTTPPDPLAAAELASGAGVRVYPVGVGSADGAVVDIDGTRVATSLDEQTLKEIAQTTDGEYFAAADEQQLSEIYGRIDLKWRVESEEREATGVFAGIGALTLAAAGAALVAGMLRGGRRPKSPGASVGATT